MPAATVLLRETSSYRRDAFCAGLKRLGFVLEGKPRRTPQPEDVLVLWNRRPAEEMLAKAYERAGARVLIAENGYIGGHGPKLFALAHGHHLGAGQWREGGPERWETLGVELKPWRAAGEHLLLLPQRGIGEKGVTMPAGWTGDVLKRLAAASSREVRIRRHPGPDKSDPYAALQGAHAAVTWASGAGVKALAAGYPVFFELPSWIGASAGQLGISDLERPILGDRLPMFRRLAWAQWTAMEIESGEAFAWLLT